MSFNDDLIYKLLKNSTEETLTLNIAIKGVRALTNRNINTGKLNMSLNNELIENSLFTYNKFIGLTNYLIVLDLIGCLFSNNSLNINNDNGVVHSLQNFSTLEKNEIKSIKNLRNSLTHNFSLGNKSEIFSISSDYEKIVDLSNERFIYGKTKKRLIIQKLMTICYVI